MHDPRELDLWDQEVGAVLQPPGSKEFIYPVDLSMRTFTGMRPAEGDLFQQRTGRISVVPTLCMDRTMSLNLVPKLPTCTTMYTSLSLRIAENIVVHSFVF